MRAHGLLEDGRHRRRLPPAPGHHGAHHPVGRRLAGHRAPNALGSPLVVAVGHGQVAAHLGIQQLVEIVAAPIGQRRHDQGQHDAQRQQGKQ